ncbi:MAG: bifunctional histidinol-phosphatase/imidazoleglycerol-phosphate dehydratase HisB [Gammaproteobacteria bacterium]|nr:bifunctional histidinol-phosphatase/imidazoleglycerol-phosphate dehydratase HisB [Gammaproteobacteria bacterium]MDH4314851.1 bifunctional histidinol-phosphatase/imidazoleglycerol-phosphate dehydratase HisB [Gammaproteobacteria bacterium]MDH5214654.1 bifunctional histidinol-phosphatase/imidazoleglycerol-phosphate dehydratase HisB [Gammaproteobacteria bacterium]
MHDMNKVLFIDRDGTLIEEPGDFQVDRLDKVRLLPAVIPSLISLRQAGFSLVMVSNQDGLGSDGYPLAAFEAVQAHIVDIFASQGIVFDEVFICPHLPAENCDCRKPRTGLLTRFLASTSIDTHASAVIGDRDTDLQLADKLGLRGFRVMQGGDPDKQWPAVTRELLAQSRRGIVNRKTRETEIAARVDLDATEPVRIDTGIGFYDHMLEQIARHGGFSLTLECRGDLQVDEHHTVEDTAICLGTALRHALGNKRGIERYGFLLPMDESEARVALDLSGRAAFEFKGDFPRPSVGELPSELVPHFFRSLADSLGAALHIEVRGENAHHMIEACFKSVGRTLRQAIRAGGADVPSTKGTLS